MVYQIKKGLNVPITGQPVQAIKPGPPVESVALLGDDYQGMRPTMDVAIGDRVKQGQRLFEDKKNPGVIYTAPGCGTVTEINRGEKRRFVSLVIALDGDDQENFQKYDGLEGLDRAVIRQNLLNSGLWTALRTRPFDKVPSPESEPHSIFVTAIDTNPLAAEPELVIAEHADLFVAGLTVVKQLTAGKTFVCTRDDSRVPGEDITGVEFARFDGPHPAGLVGTHIHFLDPVNPEKTVWHLNYQDLIAIGHLFTTGKLMTERVVAMGGPLVEDPGLYRTRIGACLDQLVQGRVDLDNARVISGSVLNGHISQHPNNYLGRYDLQVTVLEEGNKREFLGWQGPGLEKFSVTNIYAGSFSRGKKFNMTTSTGGSARAMVPVETYERVMPLDMLPTQLLRALITADTDLAQSLGCLELGEEDLALCTYVCPGKYDYGSILRQNLNHIEKEG
ncbi:MAG: Na(+)-translocating NADH-quinone reductase subunit A [Mariniblastus sp.]|nr:Na(+)-translocating NADH-quinone reductase subunit A [Mariniblastus sp.]